MFAGWVVAPVACVGVWVVGAEVGEEGLVLAQPAVVAQTGEALGRPDEDAADATDGDHDAEELRREVLGWEWSSDEWVEGEDVHFGQSSLPGGAGRGAKRRRSLTLSAPRKVPSFGDRAFRASRPISSERTGRLAEGLDTNHTACGMQRKGPCWLR